MLLDPQVASRSLPAGLRLTPAAEADDLHPALRSELESQPELGAWSASHLCFYAVDSIQTADYVLRDKSGHKPHVFAIWTVSASETAGGSRHDLALLLLTSSRRLARSGRQAGHPLAEMDAKIGKVPETDRNGVPSTDDRFQVKIGKTRVTWDGHPASDSTEASGSVKVSWVSKAAGTGGGRGSLSLSPQWVAPMVGSLKVEGKDELAKALKASPVRFVGPSYHGGGGEVRLER